MKITNLFLTIFLFDLYKAPSVKFIQDGREIVMLNFTPQTWESFVKNPINARMEIRKSLVEFNLVDPKIISAMEIMFGTSGDPQPAELFEIVPVNLVMKPEIHVLQWIERHIIDQTTHYHLNLSLTFPTEVGFVELIGKTRSTETEKLANDLSYLGSGKCCKTALEDYLPRNREDGEKDIILTEINFYRETGKPNIFNIPTFVIKPNFDAKLIEFFYSNATALTLKAFKVFDHLGGRMENMTINYGISLYKQLGYAFESMTYQDTMKSKSEEERYLIAKVINMLRLETANYPRLIFLPGHTPEQAHEVFRHWYNTH